MDYVLRFEVECDDQGYCMVFDNDMMYCCAGPLPEEEACALAVKLNSEEQV